MNIVVKNWCFSNIKKQAILIYCYKQYQIKTSVYDQDNNINEKYLLIL
jgi:hypothetical protein